jgi:hypothetical protein
MKVKFNMNKLKEKYRLRIEKKDSSSLISDHCFNIHIEENQNEEAEDELKRQIDKTDFQRFLSKNDFCF